MQDKKCSLTQHDFKKCTLEIQIGLTFDNNLGLDFHYAQEKVVIVMETHGLVEVLMIDDPITSLSIKKIWV